MDPRSRPAVELEVPYACCRRGSGARRGAGARANDVRAPSPTAPPLRASTREAAAAGFGKNGAGPNSRLANAWAADAAEIAGAALSMLRLPLDPWNSVRWSLT